MPTKTPVIISVVLTIILLLIVLAVTMFMQIVLLNGVMNEGQATMALGVTLACQGGLSILGTVFAGWLTRLLMARFEWNPTVAVLAPVGLVTLVAAASCFVTGFAGIAVAGIR